MLGHAPQLTITDLALPRDFDALYGDKLATGLSLGGGGLFFVAWQIAYLHQLAADGVRLDQAQRTVGTSAGSVVAAALLAGRLGRVKAELSLVAKVPAILAALAPSSDLHPSQQRALDLFWKAADNDRATIREIGHAALAATTPSPEAARRSLALLTGRRGWPSPHLFISCVDAYSGERCMVTEVAGVPALHAAAASSAVPGIFPTQLIGDRWCMDGGVSGSGVHLDVLAGAKRVVVLALNDGTDEDEGALTSRPGDALRERHALEATGTQVFLRTPEQVDYNELMSPQSVPRALEMGSRQAKADVAELRTFWSPG